tara:strand:+ start:135 stop:1034 length:900 start_codon:yes stop_codon:yes gene_type:complete
MKQLALIFSYLILLPIFEAAYGAEKSKPALAWLSYDWQPAWITEGPLKGQGYAQSIERILKESLPDFQHKTQKIINVRTYTILKNSDACFASSSYQGTDLTVQQKDGLIWSAPTFLFFYHGIILHSDARALFTPHIKGGYISLTSAISDPKIIGLYQPGRQYSRWIMPILDAAVNHPNIFRWSSNVRLTQSKFKMLEAKRIDYFIDYGFLLEFHKQTTNSTNQLLYLPLEEHRDTIGLGAIACNDTAVGQKAISQINALLLSLRQTEEYKVASSRWLMPEGLEQEYWQLWEEEVLSRTK